MSVIRRNATGGKSSLTVAATNTADRLKRQSIERSAQWPPAPQFPHTAMEAAKPGSRSRSTDFFSGGSGAARSAPPVRPSAQPFFRLRVPRTERN